jgi:hypothetical protein
MSAHGDKADAFALSEGGRLCPDASEQVAGRVKAFKNRGRGFFNRKNYDRAMANHGEARILEHVAIKADYIRNDGCSWRILPV